MLQLGPVRIDPPLVLAPMAGITDHVYRLMLRRIGGVGLVTMEFISSEAITRGNARQLRKLVFSDEERPLSIQIYGSDPERMAAAADIVEELAPDVCDINMGCPANKVLKGCAGAALMGDLPLARDIVRAVKARLSIPLTVKFRLGLDERRMNFLDLGAHVRGRGRGGGRDARAHRAPDVHRAGRLLAHRGAEAAARDSGRRQRRRGALRRTRWRCSPRPAATRVMIGRATMKNPWIFRQIEDRMAGRSVREATLAERRDLMLAHFTAIEQTAHDPKEALHKLRTMTGWYTNGLPHGRALRIRISELATPADFRAAVVDFFQGAELAIASRRRGA